MKRLKIICGLGLILLFFLSACSDNSDALVIKGKVQGAKNERIYLRKMVNQKILLLDSTDLRSNGSFSFKSEKPVYPEFYFLSTKTSGAITLLSDSNTLIKVETTMQNFVDDANVLNNEYSNKIQQLNKRLAPIRNDFIKYLFDYKREQDEAKRAQLGEAMRENLTTLKLELGKEIVAESKSFYAYYMLYLKLTDDYLLFDPFSTQDAKYFAAVANVLSMYYPEAPRTKALVTNVKEVMAAKRSQKLSELVANTPESIPEINKMALDGKEYSLQGLKGKLVVLNYWASGASESVQWNKVLKSIYGRYHSRGLEIYQYSADKSKILWEDAVKKQNIKWISVCDFEGEQSDAIWKYNVQRLPSTFLISKEGKLLGKFDSELKLREAIKEHI